MFDRLIKPTPHRNKTRCYASILTGITARQINGIRYPQLKNDEGNIAVEDLR